MRNKFLKEFLDQEEKNSRTDEDNRKRFYLFEKSILAIETANFETNARRLRNLEPNEIFINFFISRKQIDEMNPGLFYFKDMD